MHAENGEGVVYGQEKLFNAGIRIPEAHAISRPAILEAEATNRAINLAELIDVPLYVVHVTSKEALHEVNA